MGYSDAAFSGPSWLRYRTRWDFSWTLILLDVIHLIAWLSSTPSMGEEFYVRSLLSLVLVIALQACKLDYGEIMLVYLSKKPYMLVRIKHKCQPIWESMCLCANMQGWTLKIHPAIPGLILEILIQFIVQKHNPNSVQSSPCSPTPPN